MSAPARDAHEDATYARIEGACARQIGAHTSGWHCAAITRAGARLRCALTPDCAPREEAGSVWVRGRAPGDAPPAATIVLLEATREGWHRVALAPETRPGNALIVATFESEATHAPGAERRAERWWLRAPYRPRSARERARECARALAQWVEGTADPGNPFERLVRETGWGASARAAAACATRHADALQALAHHPWAVTRAQEDTLGEAGREALAILASEEIEDDE